MTSRTTSLNFDQNFQQNFHLGHLPTEQPHPDTLQLSQLVKNDLAKAVSLLFQIDRSAWNVLKMNLSEIEKLAWSIKKTIQSQNRVFLCGCGATGRLSLSLDWLLKAHSERFHLNPASIVSFMAGGDSALVSALEGFEDYPELGQEHLKFMGFKSDDLLIASTEGGETPYVIGATLYAAQYSSQKPWFLFCNPKEVLINSIPRSREVLTKPEINNLEIATGPMPLAGSTRMQASSVLMAAIGLALFEDPKNWESCIDLAMQCENELSINQICELIHQEALIYQKNQHSIYHIDKKSSITVFTDTTERAPTFSLRSFDHPAYPEEAHSLSYISIDDVSNSQEAWLSLLGRKPIALNRSDLSPKSTLQYLQGFDFSHQSIAYRKTLIPDQKHIPIFLKQKKDHWNFEIQNHSLQVPLTDHLLMDHLRLKSILNLHSTLMMGLLNRYTGNLMTYVKPTNGKLIDRAVRYVLIILKEKNIFPGYEKVLSAIQEEIPNIQPDEPIVMIIYKKFIS